MGVVDYEQAIRTIEMNPYDIYTETHEMVTRDFTHHLERLLAMRARLRGVMTKMTDNVLNNSHSRTSMPIHMAELGSSNFDQEFTLSLLGSEKNALDQIEAAIKRVEDGMYGRCETCGMKIRKPRLEAIPYAAQCVQCAAELEPIDFRRRSQPRVLPR